MAGRLGAAQEPPGPVRSRRPAGLLSALGSSPRAALAAGALLAALSGLVLPSARAATGLHATAVAEPGLAAVQPAASTGNEGLSREAIARQRAEVLKRHADEERACAARFAVTACIDEVRARQRAALAPLRERELALDDAERRRRAADRLAAAQARQQGRAADLLRAEPPVRAAPEGAAASAAAPDSAPAAASPARRAGPVQARLRQARDGNPTTSDGAPQTEPQHDREARAAARVKEAEARRLASVRAQERIARRLQEQAGRQRQRQALPPASAASAAAPAPAGTR